MEAELIPARDDEAVSAGVEMLEKEIRVGLAELVSLNKEGGPAGDTIDVAVFAWMQALTTEREWAAETDRPRIRKAFGELLLRDGFPTPLALINILDRPPAPRIPTHEENQVRREAEKQEAEERRRLDAEHAARYAPQVETREELLERSREGLKKCIMAAEMAPVAKAAARRKLLEGRRA